MNSSLRIQDRGGGQWVEFGYEWLAAGGGSTCQSLCQYRMQQNSLAACDYDCGANPHNIKCWDASSINPLNGRRISFPSQEGTTAIDPLVPIIIPYTNWTACIRMR